jgi:hypothetical protein
MTYWSSTSGDQPGDAWFVDFISGDTGAHGKDQACDVDEDPTVFAVIFAGHVRAVRGGSFPGAK